MILLPSAAGTAKAPSLIKVPGAAVTNVRVWQTAQPIAENSESPRVTAAVIGPLRGARVAAMKSAKASTSSPSSSGSGTGSKADGKVTLITPPGVVAGFS